jgi:pimeloyl-ACP methyl ester carboxylesterase
MRQTILATLVASMMLLASAAPAQTGAPVPARDYITKRLAELQKVRTPEGVESLEQVELGGLEQWISIRGQNRKNPVLLFIHGGPGSPEMPQRWLWQRPIEDYFTVVQWDQRGVGKNALTHDSATVFPTLSLDRIVKDGIELAELLRRRFDQPRIVVMGHSWGSVVGLTLAHRRPDLLHAYVGVGQAIGLAAEHDIWVGARERAERAGNREALRELDSIAPYPSPAAKVFDLPKAMLVRKWGTLYNGLWYGVPTSELMFEVGDWGPEYTAEDIAANSRNGRWAGPPLIDEMATLDFRRTVQSLEVPVVLLHGRWDLLTAYAPAARYFAALRAPRKSLVTFERSGHLPMLEEPGRFLVALVQDVLPLTGSRGAFPPP